LGVPVDGCAAADRRGDRLAGESDRDVLSAAAAAPRGKRLSGEGRAMSAVASSLVARSAFRPSFYFCIAAVMFAYVFGGFTLAAIERYVTNDPKTMPPVVHLHGVTFISWMSLLMIQTFLVNAKNVAL